MLKGEWKSIAQSGPWVDGARARAVFAAATPPHTTHLGTALRCDERQRQWEEPKRKRPDRARPKIPFTPARSHQNFCGLLLRVVRPGLRWWRCRLSTSHVSGS